MRSILTRLQPNKNIISKTLLSSFSKNMGAFPSKIVAFTSFSTTNDKNNNIMTMKKKKGKKKMVVIMGPTGSGKSRLSIDIAKHFSSEILNSDKCQFYKGLEITTNQIPHHQRFNIPHHLLGEIDSSTLAGEFTHTHYRYKAASVISSIHSRHNLPLLVGGSNSYIYALLADRYDPNSDVFSPGPGSGPITTELKYDCCFLWIDIDEDVLNEYLVKRVDEMISTGMVDELAEFYSSGEIDKIEPNTGLRKAIGVKEFEPCFRGMGMGGGPNSRSTTTMMSYKEDLVRCGAAYEQAVKDVKDNTCQLAKAQLGKIQRLRNAGWDIHKLDGTDSFQAVLDGSKSWAHCWDKNVVQPSVKIVTTFLEEE